jgi:DNA-binding transcriptional LysR family regulator
VNLHQTPPVLETLLITREQFAVCLPAAHPLAKQKTIDLAQLRQESFILFTEDAYNRLAVVQACEAKGFTPKVLLSSSQVETHKALVAKGMGISFLIDKIVAQSKGLITRPLTEPICLEFGLAWKKDRYLSRASQAFIDFVVASKGCGDNFIGIGGWTPAQG